MIAFYFLFVTCHFLPVTSYFLLFTRYLLHFTSYALFFTCYFLVGALFTSYLLLFVRHSLFLLVTRYDNWQKAPNPYYFMKTPFYCLPLPRFQILSNPPPHLRSFCYLVSSAECVILLQLICYFAYFFFGWRGVILLFFGAGGGCMGHRILLHYTLGALEIPINMS